MTSTAHQPDDFIVRWVSVIVKDCQVIFKGCQVIVKDCQLLSRVVSYCQGLPGFYQALSQKNQKGVFYPFHNY